MMKRVNLFQKGPRHCLGCCCVVMDGPHEHAWKHKHFRSDEQLIHAIWDGTQEKLKDETD